MKIYELRIEDEFYGLMNGIARGSSSPISGDELLKRWLAIGLAYDAQKTGVESGAMINQFLRITRK